ncbi:uncharacterized protein BX664DRAFT_314649 [Halteromyces radiatus]|uniref:uncharacterized protein n=1 Tax=Halteromyces radiatus TaxID=101107 RepID=UPI00221E6414|nr:uncharacterized protein BX664DRAFT_314649 [Halteromyces radiatus]KAI8089443.1 hypothetical protein BX664DRAFT_314649 [Halteromyces radiatus]
MSDILLVATLPSLRTHDADDIQLQYDTRHPLVLTRYHDCRLYNQMSNGHHRFILSFCGAYLLKPEQATYLDGLKMSDILLVATLPSLRTHDDDDIQLQYDTKHPLLLTRALDLVEDDWCLGSFMNLEAGSSAQVGGD